ncbi:conserved hypothetical protein [Microbacterium sp. 8M]|uniref:hypothetical protein n=1 Tax=Microbacterium sp. 8M TaxID=2653153 RepID=UPI0012F43D0F|nr:hypothetical protein [Microbacterium sp. 8M]VXB26580.1 conserved hypothetical protein [Microbacterium sp. 8M]
MMPQTPDTVDRRPDEAGAAPRRTAIYPLIDVDPDFHIPARREGTLMRMLVALRILPQAT